MRTNVVMLAVLAGLGLPSGGAAAADNLSCITGISPGEQLLLRDCEPEPVEEIIYVLSGEAEQTLNDGEPFTVRAGDTLFIPVGVYHSTINTGWEPFRAIVVYNPGGPEQAFRQLEDFQEVAPGVLPGWQRAE